MRIKLANGRIIDPANKLDKKGDLFIENGKILSVNKKPSKFTPDKIIEANELIVCPGLVDLSAHLREPGQQHNASISSETTAASSGGITSICCPPDTQPVIDTPAVVELIHQRAKSAHKTHVFPLGAMTHALKGKTLAEMWALSQAGCIGVSNAQIAIDSTEVLRRALEYAATFGITVHLYCEDSYLRNSGVAHEGAVSVRMGLPAIPETAETVAISRVLLLVEQCGTHVHFCRLSCRRSVELIAAAKKQGLPVTADVSIAHLHLTEIDLGNFNSHCHLQPPLRSQRDKEGLHAGLADGTIDSICSNHQPHDDDAKSAPFSMTEPGASLLEVLLPLTLQLVDKKSFELSRAIAALTIEPAKIAGITAGTLSPGAAADVCIFDPEAGWTLDPTKLVSAGKNTPFAGWEMTGKVTHTLLEGQIVYES
jgi:dihydroorotase